MGITRSRSDFEGVTTRGATISPFGRRYCRTDRCESSNNSVPDTGQPQHLDDSPGPERSSFGCLDVDHRPTVSALHAQRGLLLWRFEGCASARTWALLRVLARVR